MEKLKAVHETEEADNSNEVTVKHIDNFAVKQLRIPKRPPKHRNNMLERLLIDKEDDKNGKTLSDNQTKRMKNALKRRKDKEQNPDDLAAENEKERLHPIADNDMQVSKKVSYHPQRCRSCAET
jgi:hypothetical protein